MKCYVTNAPKPPDQHPAIKVVKDGPATAHSGDQLTFSYTVTNPGDVPLTNVTATDDKCSPLTRTGDTQRHDARPGRHVDLHVLVRDPVERGRCQSGREHGHDLRHAAGRRQPAAGRREPRLRHRPALHDDRASRDTTQPTPPASPDTPATASGTAPTTGQPPQIAVSPVRVRPGSARLRGPSGCPTTSAVAATVSGRRIVKVTFYVDSKKVKTLTQPNKSGGRWVLPMNVKRFAFGSHRVQARIQFARSSQTKSRTLRLSFSRCHPANVKPKFTG